MTDKSAMMEKLDAHHLLLDGSAARERHGASVHYRSCLPPGHCRTERRKPR